MLTIHEIFPLFIPRRFKRPSVLSSVSIHSTPDTCFSRVPGVFNLIRSLLISNSFVRCVCEKVCLTVSISAWALSVIFQQDCNGETGDQSSSDYHSDNPSGWASASIGDTRGHLRPDNTGILQNMARFSALGAARKSIFYCSYQRYS